MRKVVVSYGELLWDLLDEGPQLGGAPGNLARRLHLLGEKSALVSRVGADPLGRQALAALGQCRMGVGFVQIDPALPTGTVQVALDDNGEAVYHILPEVAYDHIEFDPLWRELGSRADAVCFGTLAQRSPTSRASLDRLLECCPNAVKVLDINLRKDCHTPESIRSSMGKANILKLTKSEITTTASALGLESVLVDRFAREMVELFRLDVCLITLGAEGAFAMNRKLERVYVPGYQVKVVDTCGSGDACAAGFVHMHLRGASLLEACSFGNALGALVATTSGATQPISKELLAGFLANPAPRSVDRSLARYLPS